MDWKTHKKQLLKNSAFRQALKETEVEFQIAKSVIEARLKKGLSQQQLARQMGTRQSVISRLENVKTIPSLSFLKRLAEALDSSLEVQFKT